jgi:ferredoxin
MVSTGLSNTIIALFSLGGGLFFGWFSIVSIREKERRAAWISAGLSVLSLVLNVTILFHPLIKTVVIYGLISLSLLAILLFLLPIGKLPADEHAPTQKVDERTIMFARHRLRPGTPEYKQYYALYPDHERIDERTRSRPGLLSPGSKYANPPAFAATDAGFRITEALHQMVEGEPASEQYPFSPQAASDYLKSLARFYGAEDVGITDLKIHHVYSHIGRGPGEYGSPVQLDHTYALAFTVEMNHQVMGAAPQAPVVMESAHQYVEAGKIAVQLAAAIRALGYPARAHMDANYRVICPPVARDAGLGEIGRIGLLMTPRLGPRVRLGVVTTSLELIPDGPRPDPAVIDFCMVCKKCADNCPSKSIPFGERREEDGVVRWRINQETCFAYWNEIGTDCGICMAVCPFSHPDNALHNLTRGGIARSGAFRRFALWMDNLFYGRKPARKSPPKWLIP